MLDEFSILESTEDRSQGVPLEVDPIGDFGGRVRLIAVFGEEADDLLGVREPAESMS